MLVRGASELFVSGASYYLSTENLYDWMQAVCERRSYCSGCCCAPGCGLAAGVWGWVVVYSGVHIIGCLVWMLRQLVWVGVDGNDCGESSDGVEGGCVVGEGIDCGFAFWIKSWYGYEVRAWSDCEGYLTGPSWALGVLAAGGLASGDEVDSVYLCSETGGVYDWCDVCC